MIVRDEFSLRREAFREGIKIRLGDGQEWAFPRPRLRIFPLLRDDGTVATGVRNSWGLALDAHVKELMAIPDDDPDSLTRTWTLQLVIATKMLLENYELDAAAVEDLLTFSPDDDASVQMWRRIAATIGGYKLAEDEVEPHAEAG